MEVEAEAEEKAEAEAEAKAEVEAEVLEAMAFWWKRKQKLYQTISYFFQILFDVYLNYVHIILVLKKIIMVNIVSYVYCINTFQKGKQNWKQFRKRKRSRKHLLSAGSKSAGSGST
jgi:hypothetical protein